MRLTAVSRAAKRAGLSAGLTLASARARIPDLWVEEADPAADAALLDAVAEDCDRISPVVMMDPPAGLTLDITGCAHLFGGEAPLRLYASQRLRRAGLHARTAIAGAPDTARALARFGHVAIVPSGGEAEAVRPLPVAALCLPEQDRTAITRAGLKTIGALADRPGQIFACRFGEAMTTRLRRVQGLAPAPLVPRRPVPMLWVERRFAEPIGRTDDIEAALEEMMREACLRLSERREGGRQFEAAFHRSDSAVRRIAIVTGRGVRDPSVVMRLFRERLETLTDPLDPGFGFDMMRLSLLASEKLDAIQPGLDGRARDADEAADLAARLSTRFGADRVVRFESVDTHDPHRAARAVPARSQSGGLAQPAETAWPLPHPGEPPLRPLHLFAPPQPVSVKLTDVPDGPPRRFMWRRRVHEIMRWEGPERIAPEWWRESRQVTRDYYRVEDAEGRRFWVFRSGAYSDGSPAWYIGGVFA
jgi:protein ImuB